MLSFGVSGRLYKSNVLLYDHQTESLWSQLLSQAVSGEMAGKKLTAVASARTRWKTWKDRHPGTEVLSTKTGYARDYNVDPYVGYYRVGTIWFPVGNVRNDLSPKERILGIEINGNSKAYPIETLSSNPGTIEDGIGNERVRIHVNPEGEIVSVVDVNGKPIPHLFAYWFAWQAFHPDTNVYKKPF